MKKYIFLSILFLGINSCIDLETHNETYSFQNIVILSDLSSRLVNKPAKDIQRISKILDFFTKECVKPGEKIGDRSSIRFLTFSGNRSAIVDLNTITSLGEKQEFINSTGRFKNSGFNQAIFNFKKEIVKIYNTVKNPGLDLISILNEKTSNEKFVKSGLVLTSNGVDTTFLNFDNHVYILTDGYLEYQNKDMNPQFYFGKEEIERIRKYCQTNRIEVSKAVLVQDSLKLPPLKNSNNKLIHLHILETHERDKDDVTQTYRNPAGLRDNEILEAVWRQWASESGFLSFEWEKY
jgi:hypothetical protein